MGEIKNVANHHVKVDNWPLFFLQRLHHFYRKKTHCDLTLLFSSLDSVRSVKVHKLVLHACTDYFESLDIKEDSEHGEVLELSNEMHPDVIIPIISFMYTGKLEFPVSLQPKLYEAATKLRMTILTKLLDVQPGKVSKIQTRKGSPEPITLVEGTQNPGHQTSLSKPIDGSCVILKSISTVQSVQGSDSPNINNAVKTRVVRKNLASPIAVIAKPKSLDDSLPPTLPGRKLPVWKRKLPSSPLVENTQNSRDTFTSNPPRPTRFEWDEDLSDPTTIKPVEEASKILSHDQPVKISHPIILDNSGVEQREASDDSVRRSFSDGSSSESPPYKRFRSDLQDMKEYGKQQQLRNEIICSEENMDDMMDADDLYGTCEDDADPDDPDEVSSFSPLNANSSTPKPILKTVSKPDPQMSSKRVRFSLEGKENNQQENESSGGDFTALKEPESDVTSQKIVVPVSQIPSGKQHVKIVSEVLKKYPNLAKKDNIKLRVVSKNPALPATVHRAAKGEAGAGSKSPSPLVSYIFLTNKGSGDLVKAKTPEMLAKEKLFDVENRTGPWLCHVCNSSKPLQFDSYYTYRRHLVQVHELRIDARICEYCGLKNSKRNHLLYHLYTKHGIDPPPNISFPKCNECDYIALSETLLTKHKSSHDPRGLTCYTCNVVFKSYSSIQMHMKSIWHKNKVNKVTVSLSDYPCPFCNIRFENGSELKDHIESCHHSQTAATKIKKQIYRCPYCEGIFHDGDKLGKHIVCKHWGKKTQVANQETKAETNDEQSGQQLEVSQEVEEGPAETGGETVVMQPSSESESLTNVASGIAASLGLAENDQTVVFYEQTTEDQELGRETTIVAENDCKEYIVINPIEVEESRQNTEVVEEVEAVDVANEDSNSRLSNTEVNPSSCSDHDYSEPQTEDSGTHQEVISVQEVEGSGSSVIQQILPEQGLVFANEEDVVFESSCVSLPQRVILTSGKLVLPEASSSQQGVILSQVLPQTRIILTSPGILEQSGDVIEEGSTIVFESSENGEPAEAAEETVQYTAQSSEVSKEAEKQEEQQQQQEETVIVLASCEPGTENLEKVKEEEGNTVECIEVQEEEATENKKVIVEPDKEKAEVNQSVIKTVGGTCENNEIIVEGEKISSIKEETLIVIDDDATPNQTNQEVIEVEDDEKEKERVDTNENAVEDVDVETSVETSTEPKTPGKSKKETKTVVNRVETSQIVDDWDETNDNQTKVESRSDGPSRPEFF